MADCVVRNTASTVSLNYSPFTESVISYSSHNNPTILVQTPPLNYLGSILNVAFSIIFHMSTFSDNQLSQTFFYLKVLTIFLFKLLTSSTHRVCLAHLILHHTWCNFLQLPVTSYLLGPHPLLRIPLFLLFAWSERLSSTPIKTSKITSCMLSSIHF